MPPRTRARTGPGYWTLLALLLLVLIFAPAIVARSVTADSASPDYLRAPWYGWTFAGEILRNSVGADAASPGDALRLAKLEWPADGHSAATQVELAYAPGDRRVKIEGSDTSRTLDPKKPLVWLVRGHTEVGAPEVVIGALDFSTGDVIWDASENTSTGTPAGASKEAE
jgi:hypothetical protein